MRKSKFREVLELFLEKTKLPLSVFGKDAVNDPAIVIRVRNGRECREATQERVLDFMRNYAKDKGIEWEY